MDSSIRSVSHLTHYPMYDFIQIFQFSILAELDRERAFLELSSRISRQRITLTEPTYRRKRCLRAGDSEAKAATWERSQKNLMRPLLILHPLRSDSGAAWVSTPDAHKHHRQNPKGRTNPGSRRHCRVDKSVHLHAHTQEEPWQHNRSSIDFINETKSQWPYGLIGPPHWDNPLN